MLQPGWISTLLPISATWMAQWAPTLQSRPIFTPGPITAAAPITVPAPISTSGPITASGSTTTPSSRRAVGSMMADGAMPSLPAQRIAMPFPGNPDEGAEWLGGFQHRDMIGHARGKTVANQARAGLGGGELVGIFEVIEEGQVPRAGLVERSEPPDLLPAA